MSNTQELLNVQKLLDELHEVMAAQNSASEKAAQDKLALLTSSQAAQFEQIDNWLAHRNAQLDKFEKTLRAQIKAVVLQSGKVRGKHLQAILVTRTKWNSKGLDGFMVAHPEIAAFRSETKSVTIRKV